MNLGSTGASREGPEWNASLKGRYFAGDISGGNNLHFVFSQFNTLFQLTCALRRMTWKPMGYSFVFHPSGDRARPPLPSDGRNQTLNRLSFHWLVSFCCSSSIRRWLSPRSHISQCTKDAILFTLARSKCLAKWEQRGKSPKQPRFTSSWDYSVTGWRMEEGASEI